MSKDKIIKILYVPTLNIPVYYWRMENYASALVKEKKRCAVHVIFPIDMHQNQAWDKLCIGYGEQSKQIQEQLEAAFRNFDVIIFQKIQYKEGNALISKYKERFPNVKIVAEIDDSIPNITPSNQYYDAFSSHHKWAANHVMMSDAVITSTEYLKEMIRNEMGYKKPIHVAPNCIDTESWKYKTKETKPRKLFKFGYLAGSGHDEDLLIIYRATEILRRMRKDFRVHVNYGGTQPSWFKPNIHFKINRINEPIHKYPQMLYNMKLNCGLAPLRDTDFNRSKSNLRYLEYSSMNIPTIASNIEPFKKTKGKITLVENDIEDWVEKMYLAINGGDDHDYKSESLKNYNIRREARKVLNFLENLVEFK